MSTNELSTESPTKRKTTKMDRLQKSEELKTFDNAGFESDVSDAQNQLSMSTPILDENHTTTRRKLPNQPKASAPSYGSTSPTHFPTCQNLDVVNSESIELHVKDGNLKQPGGRKVLETINLTSSSNTQINGTEMNESDEGRDTVNSNDFSREKEKSPSRPQFLSNLKRFESTVKNYSAQLARPSNSSVDLPSNDDVDSLSKFTKSYSMREGKSNWAKLKPKKRTLRDLSFSDAVDSVVKYYGTLKKITLPHRHGNEPIVPETISILESLMQDLIKRGKVHQVAVLDREESTILASVPTGMLSAGDALGMVKSIICTPSLFKLMIGDVDYNCFKIRHDAVQGRAPDLVMVMQITETCVVTGFSRDDAPGSCNSEVNEFTKVLENAGW